jgi:hypothetical protein
MSPQRCNRNFSYAVLTSLLVIMLVGLSCCNGDSTKPPKVTGECTPPASVVLEFYDDFSNVFSGWPNCNADTGYCGSAYYCESDYMTSDQESEYYILITEPKHSVPFLRNSTLEEYSDFIIQVDCRLATEDADGFYGLAFRRSLDSPNGYRFIVSTTGEYWIEQVADDNFSLLIDWTESASIKRGGDQINRLMVECRGSKIKVCINGQLLTSVTGKSEKSGYIGFFAATSEQPNVTFCFDNFYLHIYP